MRGVVSGLEGSTVIEIDLGKLQQWTDGNPTQFPKGRGQAHPIGQTHPQSRPCWNQVARSSSSVEMPWGVAGFHEAAVLLVSKAGADLQPGLHQHGCSSKARG